jgi:uncharacterized membrane protein
MQLALKVGRWGTALALLFAASWAGFLGYMVHGWVAQWPHVMETLPQKASLATNAIAESWWVLWLFGALTLACAFVVMLKREVPLLFAAIVAGALLLSAGVFNVMVVSAGFEMSAMAGR